MASTVRPTLASLRDWVSTEANLTREGLQPAINRSHEEVEALLWSGIVRPENGVTVISSLLDQIGELGIVNLVENKLESLESNYLSSADLTVDISVANPLIETVIHDTLSLRFWVIRVLLGSEWQAMSTCGVCGRGISLSSM